MGNAHGNADSLKEELGWLKVLLLASLSAIVVSGVLVWMNYAAYRNIRQLKNLP